ncbi:MAG: hypothetical protein AABX13_03740 [Nanoarchaeota archaeon]
MARLSALLHLLSDFGNAALLLYALFVERAYSVPFLLLVILVLALKIIGDLLE